MNTDKKYLIKLECIDEGNSFDMNLGETAYACGWDGTDFTRNINDAAMGSDINYMKEVANRIKNEGYFTPTIHEAIITLSPAIEF